MKAKLTSKGRWNGKRADGRHCDIRLFGEWEELPPNYGESHPTLHHIRDYLLVGNVEAEVVEKGKYRLPSGEVVTCADPDAP